MKDARTLTSTFAAFLFAATLLLGGCAGSLTGPEPDATSENPVYQVDSQQGQQADRNENGDGSTTTGASHNLSDD